MTVCPIAIVSSCKKCALFEFCPLKTVLGDHIPQDEKKSASKAKTTKDAQKPKA
jgi:hypothetical protein